MTDFHAFKATFAVEQEATWARVFERHQHTIKIKKSRMALPNLELIISTTLKICNHSSFSAMSLRDLSQTTGLSTGALYSYIESKESLLSMILEHVIHLVETVLGGGLDWQVSPRERLRWLLRSHVFLSEVMQPWFYFAFMEAKNFTTWGRRLAMGSELRTQGLIADCLRAGQASGTFRPHDPLMTASLIKPVLQDWYLKRWKYRHNNVSPDDYALWVIRFVEAFIDTAPTQPARPHIPAHDTE